MRALAALGVEHEPDFPVSVDMGLQLPTKAAAEAVERYGSALLLSLGPAGAALSPEDAFTFLTAGRDARQAVMEKIVAMRGDRDE